MENFKLSKLTLIATFLLFNLSNTYADEPHHKIIIIKDVKHDISIPLKYAPSSQFNLPTKIIPVLRHRVGNNTPEIVADTALQTSPALPTLIPLRSFLGVGVGLGNYTPSAAPPDTNGSVGRNQYVQWVNSDIGVFDKITGQLAPGFPKPGNSIWSGFGGFCETHNDGDPIVKYDQLAGRWVLTQFALSNNGPFYQCVAVSTSEDPTGSYFRYAYQMDSFNDYPKLGLGPDAYYMTFNMFGPNSSGPRACALDRNKMLSGLPAQMQCFQLSWNTSGTLLPADLDGMTLPPTGSPEYYLSFAPSNTLLLFKLNVDFNNPNNTSFTGPFPINVANFTIACPNANDNSCAVQPNTTNTLDTLSDRLMHRFAYRQFPDHASMVVTHTVQGPAPKFSPAIRWYELRLAPGSTNPTVYQQSTFAPDSKNRFMGSIAMDKFGNIAVGYSVSSTVVYPSIEFAYRLSTDPLNTMPHLQPLVTGHGSQINNLTRWGDYSAMSIDPVDDCRFWYTNEFLMSSGSFNWSTNVSSFKLGSC